MNAYAMIQNKVRAIPKHCALQGTWTAKIPNYLMIDHELREGPVPAFLSPMTLLDNTEHSIRLCQDLLTFSLLCFTEIHIAVITNLILLTLEKGIQNNN